MTRTVVTGSSEMTVRQALELLEDLELRHLPIVDGGDLVAIVSDRDLREYRMPYLAELADPEKADALLDTPVVDAMSSDVLTVGPHESISVAIGLMLQYGIGAVPVVEEPARLVGVLSYVDVLGAYKKELETR